MPRPPGVKALTGEPGLWRVRIGDYRVVYEINDTKLIVLVVRIAHRGDGYRRQSSQTATKSSPLR